MNGSVISQAWAPDLCIYHGDCDDGFGAAWAIWKKWPDCAFVAGFYGKPLPDVKGMNVLFVDFSAKRPEIDAMAAVARSIVIIDHHKTAEADLQPFVFSWGEGAGMDIEDMPNLIPQMLGKLFELDRPPVIAFFDMNQSGATMAWQFAHIGARDSIPEMLQYIEDRDLWRFAFGENTRRFSAALRTYKREFEVWETISRRWHDLIKEGVAILRAHQASVRKIVSQSYFTDVGGHSVPVVNAPYHYASDVAHELLNEHPDAPFAASWFHGPDGHVQWSLRSEDRRLDVSIVAKSFGGGGHRNAAGFRGEIAKVEPK